MAVEKRSRRSTVKVDRLPSTHKDTVEQMLLEGLPYREIVEYLKEQGHVMYQMAICTYAKKYLAEVQMLNIAQENFKMMMDEIDKYPNLDTTEGIVRVLSSYLFTAITSQDESAWKGMKPDKLLRETNALIRAAAYKKRVDVQNQSDFDAGIEAARSLVFDSLAKDNHELYRQLSEYLSVKKDQADEKE